MSRKYFVHPRVWVVAAASAAGALVTLTGSGPALAAAADGDVDVVNTETVQVYLNAEGEVQSRRVYEQLVLTGDGTVDITNPVSEDGLRNLDGFSGFDTADGAQVATYDVDGVEHVRSVSDFEGDLPIEVEVDYELDGEEVDPGDIVGEDGTLDVQFTVRNVTSEPREVTVADGLGGTITKTVDVPLPIAGSLTTIAPKNFTEVESPQFNRAGDGKGGLRLTMALTLIPPIGPDTATFGYTAQIEDGVVPRVEVSALPVDPLASPSFSNAASAYDSGAATGAELAAGATEIDTNLLKLRDGAGDLLAGLLQLHEGSQELQDGLSGRAAPGSQELADGAGELNDGLGRIDDGAGKVADGAGRLSDGAGKLDAGAGAALTGSQKLRDGLSLISGGLGQLADTEGLPAAAEGVDKLKAGVDQMLAGFGAAGQTGTLLDGLARIEGGAGQLLTGAQQIQGGVGQLNTGIPQAKAGVDQVKAGLDNALQPNGSLDQLIAGLNGLKALCGAPCGTLPDQLIAGAQQSKTDLTQASGGLGQVSTGLAAAVTGLAQLVPGTQQLVAGLTDLKAGATAARDGAALLKGGAQQVRAGLEELDKGLTDAVAGILKLDAGALDAYTGSGDLADGLGRLRSGTSELAAGAGDLAAGSGELAAGAGDAFAGSSLIADGAAELAAGILDAADGSGLLADGLGKAAKGAPQIVDGAGRLSKEGTQVIAGKGAETAQSYGEMFAVLEASSHRAQAESMAFGAPEGATGLTAYNIIIKGEDGESGRNLARALTGLGLLAAGGAVFLLRRRLL